MLDQPRLLPWANSKPPPELVQTLSTISALEVCELIQESLSRSYGASVMVHSTHLLIVHRGRFALGSHSVFVDHTCQLSRERPHHDRVRLPSSAIQRSGNTVLWFVDS